MAIPQPELDSIKVENKAQPSVTFAEDDVGSTGEGVASTGGGSRRPSQRVSSRPSLLTGAGYAAEMTPARMPLTLEQRAARIKLMDMCYASAEGAEGEVKKLVDDRADVDARTYEGRTALHVACHHGHGNVVEVLLAAKADPNVIDLMGQTPLYEAERSNHYRVEVMLKSNGARLQQERLKSKAGRDNWAIRREDLAVQDELSQTLKSKVFRADWRGTVVVAKISKLPGDLDQEDELLNEIQILASLRHPDLVLFLGACLEKDAPIMFILEFMPGGDLQRHFLQKRRELQRIYKPELDTIVKWSISCSRALSFLHNCPKPIIHRDLKPLNLLLTQSLDLKVTDFGISKMWSAAGARTSDVSKDAYKMTGGVGSFLYMAPEVVRHHNYNEKVDVYSFALIMYFMCSGRDPFYDQGKDLSSAMDVVFGEYHKGNEPRPKVSECPKPMREILTDAWAADAESRPSAYELTARLQAVPRNAKACFGCASQ